MVCSTRLQSAKFHCSSQSWKRTCSWTRIGHIFRRESGIHTHFNARLGRTLDHSHTFRTALPKMKFGKTSCRDTGPLLLQSWCQAWSSDFRASTWIWHQSAILTSATAADSPHMQHWQRAFANSLPFRNLSRPVRTCDILQIVCWRALGTKSAIKQTQGLNP